MQKVMPSEYANLALPDQWIEDMMQECAEVPWILKNLEGCRTVLELGYGAGIVTRAMVKAGHEVTMVDGSQEFCNKAENDGAIAICSMFEDMQFIGKFDCVIASFILEHIVDPTELLMRCKKWSNRIIVVIGNADSWHRRVAVQMGIQEDRHTLSGRDHAVGHYRVYNFRSICQQMWKAGWKQIIEIDGFQFKPLPNSMLASLPGEVIKAMCTVEVPYQDAANIAMVWS